ncbi:hypothetical protein AGMMS49975_06670 [Clostridia bacterium]|nr:hypothetical protein AGMMS49975_06670 [Clostridia bacterium]
MELRIRKLRRNLELTQEELAEKLNTTKSNISKYEVGSIEPNISTLVMLADIFEVSIDYLVARTDIPNVACENKNIKNSNIAQNNSVIYTNIDGEDKETRLSPEQSGLLRIYDKITLKNKVKLLSYAFDIESKEETSP